MAKLTAKRTESPLNQQEPAEESGWLPVATCTTSSTKTGDESLVQLELRGKGARRGPGRRFEWMMLVLSRVEAETIGHCLLLSATSGNYVQAKLKPGA